MDSQAISVRLACQVVYLIFADISSRASASDGAGRTTGLRLACRWLRNVLITFGLYTTLSLHSRRPTAQCVGTFPGRWPFLSWYT